MATGNYGIDRASDVSPEDVDIILHYTPSRDDTSNFTLSKLDSLQKEHVSQLKNLEVYKNISEQQMWMTECHELEAKL